MLIYIETNTTASTDVIHQPFYYYHRVLCAVAFVHPSSLVVITDFNDVIFPNLLHYCPFQLLNPSTKYKTAPSIIGFW